MSDKPPAERPQTAPAKSERRRKVNALPLLFIDTNIFLDFYRSRNDAGISLLSKIDGLHELTITTCQVEMEFKKNRQNVISESVSLLKPPDFNLVTPAFLADAATVKVIKDRIQDVKTRVEKLKGRTLSTLENPTTHDRIYQTLQRLFIRSGSLNLRRDTPEYKAIWRRALRRFLEGRPPRKKGDMSAGDSLNWEWIVHCVEVTNRDVIIVSRDADYGLLHDGRGYANNWLTEEIKQRVNQQRKLTLVDRLSAAFKFLSVPVTPAEITAEHTLIAPSRTPQEAEVEDLVTNSIDDLLDNDHISSLLAGTNAVGWGIDTFDVSNIRPAGGNRTATLEFTLTGDQLDGKTSCGTQISGLCTVVIDSDNHVSFCDISASMEDDLDNSHESEERDERATNQSDGPWQTPL